MQEEGWSKQDAGTGFRGVLQTAPPGITRADLRRLCEIERASQVAVTQEVIAGAFRVSVSEMRAPTRRTAPVAEARQIAMYLMHVVFGLSLSAVGRHFGRDRTTAAHACRLIEDRRDDPDFDILVGRLEFAVRPIPDEGLHQ